MDKKYICYCGLYCENCATKAKVEPAARVLYNEMRKAGFEDILPFLPDGETFWNFLKVMAEQGTCTSCREGSGNPGCAVRTCAREKGVQTCALCGSYPCGKFDDFLKSYPMLKEDNALLKTGGFDAWAALQDKRRAQGYTYSETDPALKTPLGEDQVCNPEELLSHLDCLHTTGLGAQRIIKNLNLKTNDAAGWCREQAAAGNAVITRRGKNWYITVNDCEITVNARSYTIITAHRKMKSK